MSDFIPFPFDALIATKDDKGTRAGLRRLLTDTRRGRATGWMTLGGIGAGTFAGDSVAETIAGIYGLHPKNSDDKDFNFGCTCRLLRREQTKKADESVPFDQHFRRLLGRRTKEEACEVVKRMARMAEAKGIPINFRLLYQHLSAWENDWPRQRWTRDYFNTATDQGDADQASAPTADE